MYMGTARPTAADLVSFSGGAYLLALEADAGDETRSGTAQPQHGGGDLLGPAHPAERDGTDGMVSVECAGGHHLADHRGIDGPRADRI